MQAIYRLGLYAALIACSSITSQAQTHGGSDAPYLLPGAQRSHLGFGSHARYNLHGSGWGFELDQGNGALRLYHGSYFHRHLGLELAYLDMGHARRLGAGTQGLGLSLIGRLPLSPQLDLLGWLGGTYGSAQTPPVGGYGVQPGKASAFGLSLGAGLRWTFAPQWSAVLEWERYRLELADRPAGVGTTTLGLQYHY